MELTNFETLNTRTILADWRREVKYNNIDEFWKSTQRNIKELLRELLERTMQEELIIYTGREWNQKLNKKVDYRNGYYYRDLLTSYGNLSRLKVPRLRKAKLTTKVFKNYQRRTKAVDRALKDIFLAGVSTRRVGEALSCLLDTPISATTISNVTKTLDKEVRKFQNKSLLDEYQYLILDAIVIKVKEGLKYNKKVILVAYGITIFGLREIISFRQVKRETKPAWIAFLNDLFKRGLEGKNLRLIVTDGHKGLLASLEEVYPFIPNQRCWAHKSRNVTKYLPKKLQKQCSKSLRKIYDANSKQEAINQFKIWKREWFKISKTAVNCLEKDLPDMLRVFDFPEKHRIKIRTTNIIERSFREVRRRIRTMNCFSNPASCDRIIFAVLNHLNKHWKERPFKKFNQLEEDAL
ncbi:MAG: IS256 family transposase [Candidatus Hodarchaeales archaeon]